MATKDTNYLVAVHKGLDESLENRLQLCRRNSTSRDFYRTA